MFTLFPMMGMGSNGMDIAGGNGLGGPGQMQQGMPGMPGMQAAPPTPMSAMMFPRQGAQQGAGMGMPPIPAGAGQPPQQQQQGIASLLGSPDGLAKLLAILKGGQSGLPPTPLPMPTGGIPQQAAPSVWGGGGQPAPLDATQLSLLMRSMGMGGGWTGGAPT